ncbi:MAG: phosphatidate cytidylyltransferase, partial [Rhodocyclaceae bacterium]|nr:phosphatidate cytidylyltransferase [Rhodocyclaceae bacterium]
MNASTQTTLQLFGGVAGVLILASVIGALLKWRVAHGAPHSVIDNLNARVNAWWVMVAVIGIAFALGKGGVIVLFYLISFYALREFMSLSYTRRGDHLA